MDLDDFMNSTESGTLVQQSERRNVSFDMKTVTDVYRDVWAEFYSWKPGDSQTLIDSLSVQNLIPFRSLCIEDPPPGPSIVQDDLLRFDPFTVVDYGDDGSVVHEYDISATEIALDDSFKPYPTYGSCTPASRSMAPRYDELDVDTCRFIPYADDPAFDFKLEDYILFVRPKEEDEDDEIPLPDQYAERAPKMKVLKWFAWQIDMKDPDGK